VLYYSQILNNKVHL